MTMKKYQTVKHYLEAQPKHTKKKLRLKRYIHESVPAAKETFKSNYTTFALVENGNTNQELMVTGYANHVSFHPLPEVITLFKAELQKYKCGKGTVQFQNNNILPKDLIIRMVQKMKFIILENSSK
tara:strand:+ start:285 stop:662 length:378 start_codon:yes stop_codon:yes gene_type:complete